MLYVLSHHSLTWHVDVWIALHIVLARQISENGVLEHWLEQERSISSFVTGVVALHETIANVRAMNTTDRRDILWMIWKQYVDNMQHNRQDSGGMIKRRNSTLLYTLQEQRSCQISGNIVFTRNTKFKTAHINVNHLHRCWNFIGYLNNTCRLCKCGASHNILEISSIILW